MISVTVVTAWLNHPELQAGYWEAIEAGGPDDVIIVDNGSDPPIEGARIRFAENRGFQAANNAGLRAATTDAVLHLNNDIELQSANWLQTIRDKVAPGRLVGSIVHSQHTFFDGEVHPYIDGWCLAGMRDELVELGGWDETMAEPAYYGDNMLALRAQQAGLELHSVGFVGLRHLGNRTTPDVSDDFSRAVRENRARWEQAVREAKVPA